MYIRNKSGSNVEPWGSPALILTLDELWALRITLCFLFFRKSVKSLNKFPKVPLRLTPSSHTLLKAFEISRSIPLNS